MHALLYDNALRSYCLDAIAIVGIGDVTLNYRIIYGLISTLQSSGGTTTLDTQILQMRKGTRKFPTWKNNLFLDILSTLCFIFQNNENAKNSFRSGGGFIWTVSVLDGIGRSVQQLQASETPPNVDEISEAELFTFLKTLLYTLSIVLTGNIANQRYFRHDIHFSTLSDTLQSCYFIEGLRTVELCDSLVCTL